MAVTIRPLHPLFMGEVSGLDLRQPATEADIAAVNAGMDRHAVLIFPGQDISEEQHLAFSRSFGSLQGGSNVKTGPGHMRLPLDFSDPSNLDKDSKPRSRFHPARLVKLGNMLWHTDASFWPQGAKYSLLLGRVLPPKGGNTEFADMRAAYDALDDKTKVEIEDLVCEHSILFSRALLACTDFTDEERAQHKPARQSLVRTHPVTGRKSLYLASHIGGIVGWPRPEAMAFIRDLMEHTTQPEFVYSHKWTVNDLVMWDNRQTMHRGRRYDDVNYPRDVRRTTVTGDGPTAEQVAA